jgi:hypothetical protein
LCSAQKYDVSVIDELKRCDFNREFYELAFAIPEIYYMLETDTSCQEKWGNRIRLFQRFKDKMGVLQKMEYTFFIQKQREFLNDNSKKIPLVYDTDMTKTEVVENFGKIFLDYIEYPDQVDAACLIILLCSKDCRLFTEIQNEKYALWNYNNWLEYGFEEFRYYPGMSKKGNQIINNRMIDYLLNNKHCFEQELVHKSIVMIKSVINKYDEKISKAYINDSDGYTNVREKPDVKSSVLYKIYTNRPFYIITDVINDNWYKISLYDINEKIHEDGYIHKSRVRIVPKE